LSVDLEYRLKKAINFESTVGSRSKFSRGFQGFLEAVLLGVAMEWQLGN
jgi:hypothetical protein